MAPDEVAEVIAQFADAARRSFDAGFEVIEIHLAHGYLLLEFLSPLSNRRGDEYGDGLEERARFPLQVMHAVRATFPHTCPP